MNDEFSNWRRRLAGEKLPTHAENSDDVASGYFMKRNKDRATGTITHQAVAFYRNSRGMLRGKIVGRQNELNPAEALELWTWVSDKPITEEAFRYVETHGTWPDQPRAVEEGAMAAALPAPIAEAGHNEPAETTVATPDPIAAALAHLAELEKGTAEFAKVESDETMARAHNLRDAVRKIGTDGEKLRKAEKDVHLRAGQAVDAKWKPVLSASEATTAALTKAINGWLNTKLEQERQRQEAARKVQEDHDRKVREAEAANRPAPPPPPPPPPPNVPAPSIQLKSTGARTTRVRILKTATIVDIDAVFRSFRTDPELVAKLTELATRAINAGVTIDGVTVKEEALA